MDLFFVVGFQWQSCRIVGQLWVNRNSSETQGFHSLGILTSKMWSQALWETVSILKSSLCWKHVWILIVNWRRCRFNVLCAFQCHSDEINPFNINIIYLIIIVSVFKAHFLNQLCGKCFELNSKKILSLEQTEVSNLHKMGSPKLYVGKWIKWIFESSQI